MPSGPTSPALNVRRSTLPPTTYTEERTLEPPKKLIPSKESSIKGSSMPPPVNRADKPRIPSKAPAISDAIDRTNLSSGILPTEEQVSPFSTPPSSDESPAPIDSSFHVRSRPKQYTATASGRPRESYFEPPPIHHSVVDKRRMSQAHGTSSVASHSEPRPNEQPPRGRIMSDRPEHRPGLPPRRDGDFQETKQSSNCNEVSTKSPPRNSFDVQPTAMALMTDSTSTFLPPPKRNKPPSIADNANAFKTPKSHVPSHSIYIKPSEGVREPSLYVREGNSSPDDVGDTGQGFSKAPPTLTDYPDSSQANRRRPYFRKGLREVSTKYDTRLFDICGKYVCTTGYFTRVWSLVTGEMLMSLTHGDTIKIVSLAFKPACNHEDEGTRLWLGTNYGEIQEVDIPSQSIVYAKNGAHTRREVVKIFRHANEMWTLDDDGKLHIWPPDESGLPNLRNSPQTVRVPKGHTFSIVIGDQLWMATGKDIRIFQPNSSSEGQYQVLARPLNQPLVGEVTSGATISSQPDRVYFGHTDGKVTIYSREDFACLGIINVSLYKINSLSGVGDYLWAAYNTGMIYVYDTKSYPWKVKKDWYAHDNPVISIVVDRSSIWKLDRLQSASLGADNIIRLWDGMLEDDWLDAEMQKSDAEFCEFRELKALIMTWNAGATKPSSLRYDEKDANFFREMFQADEPADIVVFGFQELVDLEDKKLTAKSFFMGSKKKDSSEQEHMSRQYRDWRDHLTRCVQEYMPAHEPYHLLHTASMVGLFTCVFVKASEKERIRNVHGSEVKRGMGGLHGNKGALIMRFVLDDSSLCFINCHLAAGQGQTVHRNNDISEVLETAALPAERDPSQRTDVYVGGGDGSMILDHEVCILNGDLNYRIDTMGRDTVVNAAKARNFGKLLERDQLLLSRKRNPGFRLRAFNESPITFAPTYKYDVGTDNYDTSEKRRAPAWCDRILYRGIGRIKQLDYQRHEVRVSDHRPVSGAFKIRIKTILPKKRVLVWERCEQRFEEVKRRIASEAN
ncbi:MAG: hypothetical protein M1827_000318 [Pycnora praestabilis]|nr:MAG: hypothetical protein M1827_000318 [Pycnora praestabilis]